MTAIFFIREDSWTMKDGRRRLRDFALLFDQTRRLLGKRKVDLTKREVGLGSERLV
jgi:hypothetical protein